MIIYVVTKIDIGTMRPDLKNLTLEEIKKRIKKDMEAEGIDVYGIYDEPPIFPDNTFDILPKSYIINGSLTIHFSNPNMINTDNFPQLHSVAEFKKLVKNGGAKYVILQGNTLGIMPMDYELRCGEHQLTLNDQNIFEVRI